MTPIEYLRIETEQRAVIENAEAIISAARDKADKAKPPKADLRKCRPEDIRHGLIVWHEREAKHGGWYWHIVDEPLQYGDYFEAYVADDGCHYGLLRAWVYANSVIGPKSTA
jgi:hypothetical protein